MVRPITRAQAAAFVASYGETGSAGTSRASSGSSARMSSDVAHATDETVLGRHELTEHVEGEERAGCRERPTGVASDRLGPRRCRVLGQFEGRACGDDHGVPDRTPRPALRVRHLPRVLVRHRGQRRRLSGLGRVMDPQSTFDLAVSDLERALAFYRDGLGLETSGATAPSTKAMPRPRPAPS